MLYTQATSLFLLTTATGLHVQATVRRNLLHHIWFIRKHLRGLRLGECSILLVTVWININDGGFVESLLFERCGLVVNVAFQRRIRDS